MVISPFPINGASTETSFGICNGGFVQMFLKAGGCAIPVKQKKKSNMAIVRFLSIRK
jgi:hypothetical protein